MYRFSTSQQFTRNWSKSRGTRYISGASPTITVHRKQTYHCLFLKEDCKNKSALYEVIDFKWKQNKNYIEMMDCLKAVNSYNIMLKMLLFVSLVFSGEPKDPADLKKPNALSLLDLNLVLNVRSLKKHHEDLEASVNSQSPPEVVCITETWLSSNDSRDMHALNGFH